MEIPEQLPDLRSPVTLNEKSIATILKGYEEFRLDISGKIISSNLEAVNVTGYEEWEVIGKHISLFYTPEAIQERKVEFDLEKSRSTGKHSFTSVMVKKRQVKFWAKLAIRCVHDASGILIGYKVVLKDQTHRLISNNKLKRFKSEYRNLFDNPFIGIFKFRKDDHKVLLLNNKAEQIIGNATVAIFNDLFRFRDDFNSFASTLSTLGKVEAFEFQLAIEEGRWARIDCQCFDEEGFVEGVISDVTESKTQWLELERLNADLDNFIYRASHDLRSPLTTLMGLINLVESDLDTSPGVYYEMMRDRVTHLDHLLADLAAITYNNKTDIHVETVSFDVIKKNVLRKYGHSAAIDFLIQPEQRFHTDLERLLTIFKKLTAYSILYCNPARQLHEITIDIAFTDGYANIIFSDNGRGISNDQLAKVFDLFHKPTNDVAETGLGLYMTKLLAEKLGGTIAINSVVGEGITVHLRIPDLV